MVCVVQGIRLSVPLSCHHALSLMMTTTKKAILLSEQMCVVIRISISTCKNYMGAKNIQRSESISMANFCGVYVQNLKRGDLLLLPISET